MDLSQVTLTQIRYAVAVADTESFRAAAARCYVSQSGLSMQIQKLEELLGHALFDRSKKPILITEAGARALVQMRTVLRETERLGQVLSSEDKPAGPYRLGVIPTLSTSTIPLFLPLFVKRFPEVELTIEELQTEVILARLHADTLDAGLAATPLGEAGLHEFAIAREPMFVYLPPKDPLLALPELNQEHLNERELWLMPEGHCFRSQVLAYCGAVRSQYVSQVRFESGSLQTLTRLVDEGLGATILPALALDQLPPERRKSQVRPLVEPRPVREIGLVTSRMQLRRAITQALKETLSETLGKRLGHDTIATQVLDPRHSGS